MSQFDKSTVHSWSWRRPPGWEGTDKIKIQNHHGWRQVSVRDISCCLMWHWSDHLISLCRIGRIDLHLNNSDLWNKIQDNVRIWAMAQEIGPCTYSILRGYYSTLERLTRTGRDSDGAWPKLYCMHDWNGTTAFISPRSMLSYPSNWYTQISWRCWLPPLKVTVTPWSLLMMHQCTDWHMGWRQKMRPMPWYENG